jgi:hypothetical protein
LREDLWVNHDDISHGHESGDATEKFLPDRGVIFRKFEVAFEQSLFLDWSRRAQKRTLMPGQYGVLFG